jgi:hypothetical protein
MNLTDTHEIIIDSKDKLMFHLFERLEMGTNSITSNLVISIMTRYPGFQLQPICSLLCFVTQGGMYHRKESTQGGTLNSST